MTARHNNYQKDYYTDRSVPRMTADLVDTPYVQRQVGEVMRALSPWPGARVLDLGCGPGKYTIGMARRGLEVEGLDLTPVLVEMLNKQAPSIPTHVADSANIPETLFGRFDGVTGFFFLHHLPSLVATFINARKVLRDGGRAVFLEPNPAYLGFYAQIALTKGMTWRGERGILNMRSSNLERSAMSAGFTEYSEKSFGAAPPAIVNQRWGQVLESTLESIPGWERIAAFRMITLQ